jgi:hypothetical protein
MNEEHKMNEIGTIAGKIWETINAEGEVTVSKLLKLTDEKRDLVLMALGWLAREDKLEAETRKNATFYSLKK